MSKNTKPMIVITVGLTLLSGCTSMMPYENEFACRKKDNMGKCISMEAAYQESVSGVSLAQPMKPHSQQKSRAKKHTAANLSQNPDAYSDYINGYYAEISSMVDKPVTPMVKQAKTLRTLILPYPGTKQDIKTLWMERYAYTIIKEPDFVLGQYLSKKPKMLDSLLQNKQKK